MSVLDVTFNSCFDEALNIAFSTKIRIFTLAFYHDTESRSISIQIDDRENSKELVRRSNTFTQKQFHAALREKEIEKATGFHAGWHRSLSLGDFKLRHLGMKLVNAPRNPNVFYLAMLNAAVRYNRYILALADDPNDTVICCSGPRDDCQFVWLAE